MSNNPKPRVVPVRRNRKPKAIMVDPNQIPMTRAQRRAAKGKLGFASRADLPTESQAKIQAVVDTNTDRAASDYLKCLVYPALNESRIPDSFAQPTALVHDVLTIDIPVWFHAPAQADDGRFAVVVQPKLGSLDEPPQYKIACVDSTAAWPTDLSQAAAFLSEVSDQDIRISPDMQALTQPPLATVSYLGNGGLGGPGVNVPFGTAVNPIGGYGLSVPYSTGSDTISKFKLSPGYYIVSILNSMSAPGAEATIVLTPFGDTTINNISATNTDVQIWGGTFSVIVLDNHGTSGGFVASTIDPADAANSTCVITFTRSFDDDAGISQNTGIIQKLRPVACSALASYVGPELMNGGSIAACFVAGGTVESQFFTNNDTPLGNLAGWEKLASIKGAFDGPLKDGAYVWYSPSDMSDYNMRRPDDANEYEYPSLIISGRFTPGSIPAGNTANPVRLIVHTVYEVQTDSLLFESTYQKGSQAEMDLVLGHLVGEPHSMANAEHLNFFQRVAAAFKTAGQWIYKNRRAIGGAAVSILPMLA